jgi:hypothetical protein
MPIRSRRCCLRVVQHDLGLTRHVGQAIEGSLSRSRGGGQGHIPGPLLGEPDPGVRDREGVGRLGPGQLYARTSGLRRRLLLQNFRLILLRAGVWLTFPLRLPALARQHLVLLALECGGTASVQVGDGTHIYVSMLFCHRVL